MSDPMGTDLVEGVKNILGLSMNKGGRTQGLCLVFVCGTDTRLSAGSDRVHQI
jgi:hypothetical protein